MWPCSCHPTGNKGSRGSADYPGKSLERPGGQKLARVEHRELLKKVVVRARQNPRLTNFISNSDKPGFFCALHTMYYSLLKCCEQILLVHLMSVVRLIRVHYFKVESFVWNYFLYCVPLLFTASMLVTIHHTVKLTVERACQFFNRFFIRALSSQTSRELLETLWYILCLIRRNLQPRLLKTFQVFLREIYSHKANKPINCCWP